MSLTVNPIWSWPLVAAASVALVVLVLVTYPPRVRHLPAGWRRTLLGLRLATALLLVFAMLRPAVQFTEEDTQAAQLVVLLDQSGSMTTPDGPGGLTRRQALLKTLADAHPQLEEIAESVEVRFVDFAAELQPVSEPQATADGRYTAIGKVLDQLRTEDTGKRLVGIVLMSDGAQRAVGEEDLDPRIAARRLAEQRSVPIYTVTYGSSELSTAGLDLAVNNVLVDPFPFEKKTVPVDAQVRLTGAAGRKVRVRLLLEDRTGKGAGESGELQPLPLAGEATPFKDLETRQNETIVPVQLSFVAQAAGEYKLAVEVSPADGEGELLLNNNRVETLITIRQGGLRVAYFDVPRPEQTFINRLNQTANIQLDRQLIPAGDRAADRKLDPKLFEPGTYDVYLIGDVPASAFRQDGVDLLDQLALRVGEGAGLAMIGGTRNFGAGGYAATKLAPLLPVAMAAADTLAPGRSAPDRHHSGPIKMMPTLAGEASYLMQIAPGNNRQTWAALPPLPGATKLTPKSDAVQVYAESLEEHPLLLAADVGSARVAALAVDETWRWYLAGHQQEHQRFWQQLMLWLAHQEDESDQPVWVRVTPRNFAPGASVPLSLGARDEEGEPIADADYTVEVTTPQGETETIPARRAADEATAEFANTAEPGDYWVKVTARREGEVIGLPALTRFIVDRRDVEMDNPAADPALMSELALLTGTQPLPPEDFGDFLTGLIEQGATLDLMRTTQVTLWDGWPLLLLFVVLMSLEWFLRKRRGLV